MITRENALVFLIINFSQIQIIIESKSEEFTWGNKT